MNNDQTQPEKAPITYIKCQCGNNVFIPGKMLAPGDDKPSVIKQVWVCVGCGMMFLPEDVPKKGEEDRREKKLILPDKKFTLAN